MGLHGVTVTGGTCRTAERKKERRRKSLGVAVESRETGTAKHVDEVGKNSLTMLMRRTHEQTDVSSGEQGLLADGRVNEDEK